MGLTAKTWLVLLMLGVSVPLSRADDFSLASVNDPADGDDAEDPLPCYCPCQQQPTPCANANGDGCVCYTAEWYCSLTGDSVPVDIVNNPTFKCKDGNGNGYFYRKPITPCPCFLAPKACVETAHNKRVKAMNLNKLRPDSRKCKRGGGGFIITSGCNTGGGSDPIITGFDDRKFHFNEIGNFTLLSDGEGYMIETTFVGVPPVDGVMPKETSWTNEVRVVNAQGDKVTCRLPHILPNTSRVEMTAHAAGAAKSIPMTPYDNNIVELEEMSATAVSSGWPNPHVTGCHVSMAKLDVIVYQVSGWSQATKYESEKWAAPYTWLNIDVKLLKPLALPVTGILGSTYPLTLVEKGALDPDADFSKVIKANVATDPVAMRELAETRATPGNARHLASADLFPLGATFKGVQLPEAGVV